MKKPQALLSILLTGLLCFATACAGGNSGGSTPEAPADAGASSVGATDSETAPTEAADSEAAPAEADSGEVPTLIWWFCGGEPDDLAEGAAAMSDYTEEKIGARLEIRVAGWDAFGDRMNVLVNSGEYYDLMFTNDGSYNKFVNLGAFTDITDMIGTTTPELKSFIPEDLWNGVLVNDRIYTVPTYKDSSLTQYWGFDVGYVDKYSIDTTGTIKTLQDLDPVFRAMKEGEGNGFYPLNMNSEGFNGLLNAYDSLTAGLPPLGVSITDSSRKVVSVMEQEDVLANFRLLHQWYMDGITNPDAAVVSEIPKQNRFTNGQAFPGAEIGWAINSGVEGYTIFQVSDPLYTTGSIQGSLNSIYVGSEHKEKALELIQLVNMDHKLRDMFAYGIEGKHFEYVEDNVINKLTDTWNLASYQQATFFTMSTVQGSPADQWEQVKKLNESASSSVCLGFMINMEPIANELANCRTTWDKYKSELMTGTSDPDVVIPQLMNELKTNGFDKIMTETQSQIDAYFS